jgi:hypothetical protein
MPLLRSRVTTSSEESSESSRRSRWSSGVAARGISRLIGKASGRARYDQKRGLGRRSCGSATGREGRASGVRGGQPVVDRCPSRTRQATTSSTWAVLRQCCSFDATARALASSSPRAAPSPRGRCARADPGPDRRRGRRRPGARTGARWSRSYVVASGGVLLTEHQTNQLLGSGRSAPGKRAHPHPLVKRR